MQYFLSPLSRVADRCCIIVSKDGLSALSTNEDGNPVLYAVYSCQTWITDDTETNLNVPDIKRLSTALNCISDDVVDLTVNSNNLEVNQSGIRFKYHLLEEGTLAPEIVSREKIAKLTFENDFVLENNKLLDIIRGTSFAVNSDKVYFYVKDSKVFAELTDKELSNVDDIVYHVTDTYNGIDIKTPIPMNVEILKMFGGLKSDVKVKINTQNKVMLFKIANKNYDLKYIVAPRVR